MTPSSTSINENDTMTVTVTFTDVGTLDTHTASVAWGDGTTGTRALAAGVTSFSAAHRYLDDNPTGTPSDVASIVTTIVDDDTGSVSGLTLLTVNNVAPIVTNLVAAPNSINENSSLTISVTFTDPGTQDTFTANINWGDGTTGSLALGAGSSTFTANHQYSG